MNYEITLKDWFHLYLRSFLYQNLINDKYFQNFGFIYVLYPLVRKIKKNKQAVQDFLVKNFEYFNTNPYLVSFVMGVAIRFLQENNEDKLRKFKFDIMSPLAALGDAISWQMAPSFLALICSILVFFKCYWGVLVFFLVYNLILNVFFRFIGLLIGYRNGLNVIFKIANMDIQHQISLIKRVGLIMWGSGFFLLLRYRYGLLDLNIQALSFPIMIEVVSIFLILMLFYRINKVMIPAVTYILYLIVILIVNI
ncbi:MAG: PTS system mannose/fructose/sorbose family transporter subunit IID [bacterium]|nr:PTS system mannose/fructose/sorbose family transporter subunit IID [bacterium]